MFITKKTLIIILFFAFDIHLFSYCYAVSKNIVIQGILVPTHIQDVQPRGINWEYQVEFLAEEGKQVKKGEKIAVLKEKTEEWFDKFKDELQLEALEIRSTYEKKEMAWKKSKQTVEEQKKKLKIMELTNATYENNNTISRVQIKIDQLSLEEENLKLKKFELELKKDEFMLEYTKKVNKKKEESAMQELKMWSPVEANALYNAEFDGIMMYYNLWGRGKPKRGVQIYTGMLVVSVVDDKSLIVKGFLTENYKNQFREGDKVEVLIKGQEEVRVKGEVIKKSSMVKSGSVWVPALSEEHPFYRQKSLMIDVKLVKLPPSAKLLGDVEIHTIKGG